MQLEEDAYKVANFGIELSAENVLPNMSIILLLLLLQLKLPQIIKSL